MLTITYRGESRDLALVRGDVRFVHPDITIVPSESRFEVKLPEKEAEPMRPSKGPMQTVERSKSTVEKSTASKTAPLKKAQSAGSSFFKAKETTKKKTEPKVEKKAEKKAEKKKVIESDEEMEEEEAKVAKKKEEPKKQVSKPPPKVEPQLTAEEKEVRLNQKSQILAMFEEDRSQVMDAEEEKEAEVFNRLDLIDAQD